MLPTWLREVVLARDPRARALIARLADLARDDDRVFLGGCCPDCGEDLVLVARGMHAPEELRALLGAERCLHAPAAP